MLIASQEQAKLEALILRQKKMQKLQMLQEALKTLRSLQVLKAAKPVEPDIAYGCARAAI